MRAAFARDVPAFLDSLSLVLNREFSDPEGFYFYARFLAWLGVTDRALEVIDAIVQRGFACPQPFRTDPWLASIRSEPAFALAIEVMDRRSKQAAQIYDRLGGPAILGVPAG
jgi:hypothetical protein